MGSASTSVRSDTSANAGPDARISTCIGFEPPTTKPPISTLSPVPTGDRVERLIKRPGSPINVTVMTAIELSTLPPEFGGQGWDIVTFGLLNEALANGECDGYSLRYVIVPAEAGTDQAERNKQTGFALAATPTRYGQAGAGRRSARAASSLSDWT